MKRFFIVLVYIGAVFNFISAQEWTLDSCIARALINKQSLIIGDEPTGNLDSRNTEIIFELFQELCHEKGQTILTVTHDEDFAKRSDSTIHLKDGKIVI